MFLTIFKLFTTYGLLVVSAANYTSLELGTSIYPICVSSVIWGDGYQNIHNLLVKHRSIQAQHPLLPHIVLAVSDVPERAIDIFLQEGMLVKSIEHVNYTAENREAGFAKIMTKIKALELSECTFVVQMDVDMIVLGSIIEAVNECQNGGNVLCGVPQTRDCLGRECCKPMNNGNVLPVLVVNTGFLIYRTNVGLKEKLYDTLKMTHAKREQILWGEMICYNEDVAVHMLSWKFNTWSDMPLVPDIHVLHYSVGPNFLGGDVIPMTNDKLYEMHHGFSYYRKISLEVDSCSIHTFEAECLSSSSIAEGIIYAQALRESFKDHVEQEFLTKQCSWKGERCISQSLNFLQIPDVSEEIKFMAGANAVLQ